MSPAVKGKMKETRLRIDAFEQKAVQIINQMEGFSFGRFENKFLQVRKAANNIFPFFDEYQKLLDSQDRVKSAAGYGSAKYSFQQYKKEIGFTDITGEFLNEYENSMLKHGRSITTVGIYVRCLRKIYNNAVKEGVIKKDEYYPFTENHYVIPRGKNIKKA